MARGILSLLVLGLAVGAGDAHAFGKKHMSVSELTGATEAQVAKHAEYKKQLTVMVRGKAAELLFKMIREKRTEQLGSQALDRVAGIATHWTVHGKQVTCSRIATHKNAKQDYACAFELSDEGKVMAGTEPYTPSVFNLALTKNKSKLFKVERGLASANPVAFDKASAYVMYDRPGQKRASEDTLIVFRGQAAASIRGFLADQKLRQFTLGGAKGRRGKDISCVEARAGESDRCALVFSLDDGSISTLKNPLL